MTKKRTPLTKKWIAILLVAWTHSLGHLRSLWTLNASSGRVTVEHRRIFSSLGESWTLTRLKETEHSKEIFKDCEICCRKSRLMNQEVTINASCKKINVLKGKDVKKTEKVCH